MPKIGRLWQYAIILAVVAYGLRRFARVPLWTWQKNMLSSGKACEMEPLSLFHNHSRTVAVIVLGFSCDHGRGVLSRPLQHRLQHAVAVAEAHHAQYMLCTGGIDPEHGPGLMTEGEIMAKWLREHTRVPELGITVLTERDSASTRENAVYSLNVLQREAPDVDTVIVVTNQFHGYRSLKVFQQAAAEVGTQTSLSSSTIHSSDDEGESVTASIDHHTNPFTDHSETKPLDVRICEVPAESDSATLQKDFFRELLAIALYWARGFIKI